jgi:transcription antitermination factor NusG
MCRRDSAVAYLTDVAWGGGLVELPKPPPARAGDAVRILRGPFQGRLAIYAGMKPRARVEVLLGLLGSQQRAMLPADAVEAV